MTKQTRTFNVLVALIASMTVGGLVLMALDNHIPLAGAYSLSSYLRLDPIEQVTLRPITGRAASWEAIEVFYSKTGSGSAEQLALAGQGNLHFVVCNGKGAADGQIQYSGQWKQQRPFDSRAGLIRVCVISDSRKSPVSDSQFQRTNDLVESLSRTFNIQTSRISYPSNWQL